MQTAVFITAIDPISLAGVAAALRPRPEVTLVDEAAIGPDTVGLVTVERVDEDALRLLQAVRRSGCQRIVLVPTRLDDADLLTAADGGVCGVVLRAQATAESLVRAVQTAAAGEGSLPPDLVGRLLKQVAKLQQQVLAPRGLSFTGLSDRERTVLRLVAEGMDTREIARRLAYSDRTVKNVLHDVTTRLQLRNRSHAVAYAVREGYI